MTNKKTIVQTQPQNNRPIVRAKKYLSKKQDYLLLDFGNFISLISTKELSELLARTKKN